MLDVRGHDSENKGTRLCGRRLATRLHFAASPVLLWHQADPGREVTPGLKGAGIDDGIRQFCHPTREFPLRYATQRAVQIVLPRFEL